MEINNKWYHQILKINWNQIAVLFDIDKNYIDQYLPTITDNVSTTDKFLLDGDQYLKLKNDLNISGYSLQNRVEDHLKYEVKLNNKLSNKEKITLKWNLNEAINIRRIFLETLTEFENEFGESPTHILTKNSINNTDSTKVGETLGIDENSTFKSLKIKIESLGCLIIETQVDQHLISEKRFLGSFLNINPWPIMVINSAIKSESKKVSTLLTLLYYFLKNQKSNQSDSSKWNIVENINNDKDASKFANTIKSTNNFSKGEYHQNYDTKTNKTLRQLGFTYVKTMIDAHASKLYDLRDFAMKLDLSMVEAQRLFNQLFY